MAGAPTTPYNSIYSYINPGSGQTRPPPKKGPCCLHGKECLKEEDEESAPYVNLLVPKTPQGKEMGPVASEEMSEERRNKNLRILEREMKTLQLGVESERHRKSHDKKKKMKKKERTEDSSGKESESKRSDGEDEERKEPAKRRKKKKERSPDNRRTFGTDSSRKKPRKKEKERKSREKKKSRLEDRKESKSRKTRESRRSQQKKKKRDRTPNSAKEKTLQTSYLGVKTREEAEAAVSEPSDFRLYHRMGNAVLNELQPSLPLFLVYKAASGAYKHYRVRQVTVGETTTYMVEHGQMNAEVHTSLEHLVRFYHTQFYRHEKDGEQQVDAFPCWSDSS